MRRTLSLALGLTFVVGFLAAPAHADPERMVSEACQAPHQESPCHQTCEDERLTCLGECVANALSERGTDEHRVELALCAEPCNDTANGCANACP